MCDLVTVAPHRSRRKHSLLIHSAEILLHAHVMIGAKAKQHPLLSCPAISHAATLHMLAEQIPQTFTDGNVNV